MAAVLPPLYQIAIKFYWNFTSWSGEPCALIALHECGGRKRPKRKSEICFSFHIDEPGFYADVVTRESFWKSHRSRQLHAFAHGFIQFEISAGLIQLY
jgi:hypothetical protein